MAGALGLALAGPRRYAEQIVDDPFLNADATHQAAPDDIGRALDLFVAACAHRGGGLRGAGIGGLTTARDRQDGFDIQMRFQMIGERIERGFDLASRRQATKQCRDWPATLFEMRRR